MNEMVFSSVLGKSYEEELCKLLFFNPNQAKVASDILGAVENYGVPEITEADGKLRVTLGSAVGVQSLFILERDAPDARLMGVVVYTREDDTLVVLYVAVDEAYSARGTSAEKLLFLRIIAGLREVARRIKGVDTLAMFVGGTEAKRIRVR